MRTPIHALTLLRSEGTGGSLIRRMLPAAFSALLVLAFLRWLGERLGLYSATVGVILMTLAAISIIGGIVWHFASWLEREEVARQAADAEMRRGSRYFELSHDMLCTAGFDGFFRKLNGAWTTALGWSEDELRSRPFVEFVHPEDREATERSSAALAQGGVSVDFVNRYAAKDGGWRWIDWRSRASIEDGLIYASARDVTERKVAEELVERQRRQLSEAQAVGHFGSWEWDIAADTTEWSDGLHRIYGEEPTDETKTFEGFLAHVHPDDRAMVQAQIQTAFTNCAAFSFEHRVLRADGAIRVMQAQGDVVVNDLGVPERMRGTGQDVTERHAAERAKDQFASVVSHELRTPLTSIRGSLGLLASGVLGPLPEKGQRMVEIAVQNTDRLVRLINDILDLERIGSNDVEMRSEICDARQLVDQAAQGVEQLAAEVQVRLRLDGEPVALVADPDRVVQTLTNLISNAIKFSPAGGTVHVSCALDDGQVLFEVRDEGRGIPADNLRSIFGRFQQVDASDSREKGGTGLGLAICKTIVEHHGGRIWAASEVGIGSTFSFVLPAQPGGGPRPAGDDVSAPTILVCDDDPSVVEVVATMLEQRGYRVLAAHSGEQVLALARAERPDVILLDLLMPGTSGWATAEELKRHPETEPIPIVILSVLSPGESGARSAAVAGWVQKPLHEPTLFEALGQAISGREEPFRLLIVEDDDDLAAVLKTMFDRHGVETFHASDGRTAIELSQQVMPDMLVLDVGLPETDGFAVVDWLRHHERLSALPMVVYTARDLDAADRERLRLGDSTEFLTKGRITPQQFEERVIALLRRLTTGQQIAGASG